MAQFASRWESRRRMVRVIRPRIILLVAGVAERTGQVVVVVVVAVRTHARRHEVRVRQRESRGGVVEFAIRPDHSVMAGFASGREACGGVRNRTFRIVVIRLVARHARCVRQIVVVVDVAVRASARRDCVASGQRKASAVVIERGVQPCRGTVAGIAGLREISRDVVRIRRALIVLQVARHACRAVQVVVIVDVAIRALAWRNRMQPGEREAGVRVIEC